MIVLESVSIKNVRALGTATFEPLPASEGATALIGPNGVGKSSVLTAMLWALYGVTPDGVPVSAMRRQGTQVGEDDCYAIVTFRHDEQTVVIERGLKGNKDTTYVRISVDGTETTFGKVKAAEQWITGRLGLDAEGFLTAFVVRQKELDGLIKAAPAQRRRLIERLAGIDRMSEAVKTARDEENQVKRRLDVMPGSAQDVTNAEQSLEVATVEYDERAAAGAVTAEAVRDALTQHEDARKIVDGFDAQIVAIREYNEAVRSAETAVTLTEREVTSATTTLNDTKSLADLFSKEALATSHERRDNLHEQHRQAAGAVDEAERARIEAEQAAHRAQQVIARATQAAARAEAATQKVTTIEEKMAAVPATARTELAAAEQDRDNKADVVASLRAEHIRLTAAINALSQTDEACCPTCSTKLPDPQTLIDSLNNSRRQIAADGLTAKTEAEKAVATASAMSASLVEVDRLIPVLEVEKRGASEATAAETQARADVGPSEQAARDAAARATTTATAAEQSAAVIQDLAAQTAVLNDDIRRLENARDAADRLPTLQQVVDSATATHRAAVKALDSIEAPENAATDDEIAQARQAVAAAATALQEAQRTHHETSEAESSANYRKQAAEAELQREKDKVAARAALVAELESKAAVREALDSFRKDRIARVAPELSEVATDFVSQMTDGKFTSVDLDEEFTPIVTDDTGMQRPAAWLSGGEESAVALALRVAIGELIAGQRGGLLWLDEVLTAQDAQRRPAMMRAIGSLPGRQVITINHIAEAADMVDAVFEVIPGSEGSTITPVSQVAPVAEESVLV